MIIICIYDLYLTHFHRSVAGDTITADKFHKKAADMRGLVKPRLAQIVKDALGNDNSMGDEVLDNLLQTSEILRELFAHQPQKQ